MSNKRKQYNPQFKAKVALEGSTQRQDSSRAS